MPDPEMHFQVLLIFNKLYPCFVLLYCLKCCRVIANYANVFFYFCVGRKKVSTSSLDDEFEYVQRATNDYLDQEPFISSSVDGWENQAGDSVKMVNVIDSKCHSFLVGIVDDPGEAGDAESYKKALEPGLQRNNNVGACTDNPSVMVKARNLIRQDPLYATKVLVPCSWHATDLVVPVEVASFKAAIKDAKQIVMFFKYRHRPKGILRLKRERWNIDHRRTSDGKMVKVIPTLKVLCRTLFINVSFIECSCYCLELFLFIFDV